MGSLVSSLQYAATHEQCRSRPSDGLQDPASAGSPECVGCAAKAWDFLRPANLPPPKSRVVLSPNKCLGNKCFWCVWR